MAKKSLRKDKIYYGVGFVQLNLGNQHEVRKAFSENANALPHK